MGEKYIGVKFETVYLGDFKPKSSDLKIIDKLIDAGKYLGLMGFEDKNGGNFSFKVKNGIIIKATGSFPHKLKRNDFCLVTGFRGDKVYVYGSKDPSSEARLHWGIYQVREDVKCVLHTHDFIAVRCNMKIEGIGYVKEYPYGTLESARAIKRASKKNNYLIMENHGVIAFSKNIPSTLKLIKKYHEKFKSIKESSSTDSRVEKR
ncbi:MAG: class II aldolase/adducin family protein [Patescibacteria group bacterium]